MPLLPLRLPPGADLRATLERLPGLAEGRGYFVVSGIGSLADPCLRLAGAERPRVFPGDHELTSLAGSVSADGAHLHAVIAGPEGAVHGGHVVAGNRVRTTAEILLIEVEGWRLSRESDAATGFPELVVMPQRPRTSAVHEGRPTMNLATARIFVNDLVTAHAFYGGTLGLPRQAGGPGAGFVVYAAGACQLVVETVAADAPTDERALVGRFTGLSFTVHDIQAEHERLRGRGVVFTGAPERQAWGGILATLRDPAGNELQLVQPPTPA